MNVFEVAGLRIREVQPQGSPPHLRVSSLHEDLSRAEVKLLRDALTEWLERR